MSWICEVAITGDALLRPTLRDWQSDSGQQLALLPDLVTADFYEPAEQASEDPFNHETGGPLLIAILEFASEDALRSAMASAKLSASLSALPKGANATASAFERAFYPVGDDETPTALEAPISYVVRYTRPAENEAHFIKNYVDSHPPTQAKLPSIRSIMCYFPRPDLASPDLPPVDYLIGNEVVFDSVADFNEAMKSPVRLELRAHFKEFPPFSGSNTHYLMRRTRL